MRKTCVNMVYELAKKDDRVVFIGSDLSPGLLDDMKEQFPERHYMEGVYEQNVVGMAAGLAKQGYIPFVNTIATFLTRRCYEQVAVDLCMHDLPVRLIANGGGLVYAPLGPTHLATEDLSIMRALPNMTVVSVSDAEEMKRFMLQTLDWPHPIYIRLGKGGDEVISREENGFEIGKAIKMSEYNGTKNVTVLLVSTGIMSRRVKELAEKLSQSAINVTHLHCHTVKPLDEEAILAHAKQADMVVTAEENTLIGGLGSAVTDCLVENLGMDLPLIHRFGIKDKFCDKYGSQDLLLDYFGMSVADMQTAIQTRLQEKFADQLAGAELKVMSGA